MNDHVIERSMLRPMSVAVLVLALALGIIGSAAIRSAPSADAQPTALAAMSPANDEFGFPEWYQDDDGTRLVPCMDDELACHIDLAELPNPEGELSIPDNFPGVFFYWAAEPVFEDTGGIDLRKAEFALAGTFANEEHEPVEGDQATANEMIFELRGLTPGGRYTITHPFGTSSAVAAANGRIKIIEEAGCEPPDAGTFSCDFTDALAGPVTRFLLPADGPTEDGFLSDGENPVPIIGSPTDNNFMRIRGPGLNIVTDEFILNGQLFEPDRRATAPVTAPANVAATRGDASATVTWLGVPVGDAHDGGAPVTDYRITSTPAAPGQPFQVKASARSFSVPNLANGTSYTFAVSAVNAVGERASAPSNAVVPAGTPTAPGRVTAEGRNSAVALTWSAADPNGAPVTQYVITHNRSATFSRTVAADATSASITGLTNGQSYVFRLRAVNEVGTGAAGTSNVVTPWPPSSRPWANGGIALSGDWNGDGTSTPGWYHNGVFYLRNTNTPGVPHLVFSYGRAGDVPVVGDWNNNGTDTIGIRRGSTWHLRNSNTGGAANLSFNYGIASDTPVVGDWNNNGQDTIGIVRGTTWHLRNSNTGGGANVSFGF
jgi:hypothetical protein